MESGKRKTLQLKIREPKTDNLRNYAMSMSKGRKNSLNCKFGKILDLLNVPVQKEAFIALAQSFDPTLRGDATDGPHRLLMVGRDVGDDGFDSSDVNPGRSRVTGLRLRMRRWMPVDSGGSLL
ncbi:hypothetical protein KIW84_032977 [Lathyrus oleraceus]|uniref:DUF7745 domain-containing protein n=1 Tax=Pisum sativum TaxID=3888 RepID=A0A9D4XVP5_PEA|nr:hypothetical protein KIW84_032977 [Pisum sativum]